MYVWSGKLSVKVLNFKATFNSILFCRLLLQDKRSCLLKQLEEATRLTTYLHSQLKRLVAVSYNFCLIYCGWIYLVMTILWCFSLCSEIYVHVIHIFWLHKYWLWSGINTECEIQKHFNNWNSWKFWVTRWFSSSCCYFTGGGVYVPAQFVQSWRILSLTH